MKNLLFTCIFVLHLCTKEIYAIDSLNNGENTLPPIIFVNGERRTEIIVDSQNNLILTCKGKKPVIWMYPNNTIGDDQFWDTVVISRTTVENDNYPYLTKLELSNASYVNTGFFYCHYEKDIPNEENDKKIAKIYVYVRDEDHLAVRGLNNEVISVIAHQYDKVVIPCRPTSPDVEVKLLRIGDDEVRPNQFDEEVKSNLTFDPWIGFIYHEVQIEMFDEIFTCRFIRQSLKQEVDLNKNFDPKIGFTVEFENLWEQDIYHCSYNDEVIDSYHVILMIKSYGVEKPAIIDLNKNHTIVGEQIKLECVVHMDTGIRFHMVWNTPFLGSIHLSNNTDERIQAENAVYSPIDEQGKTTLTINNATKRDEGEYTCTVKDHSQNTNSVTTYVTVHDVNKSYIHFIEENNNFVVNSMADENVTWSINVDAHPEPNFTWYRIYENRQEEILPSSTKQYFIKHSHNNAYIFIPRVTIEDMGTYVLVARNIYEEKSVNLTLNVEVKPTVMIEISDFHMIGTTSAVNCTAAGNPKPSIYWEILPCLEGCKSYILPGNETQNFTEGLTVTSKINLKAEKSLTVICYAENDLGSDSKSTGFFVTDVEDGLNIQIFESDNPIDENTAVARGDPIKLICGASSNNYTDQISWFADPDFTPVTNDIIPVDRFAFIDPTIATSKTKFSYKSILDITSIKETVTFSCRVNLIDMNQERFESKNVTVIVKDPLKPKITRHNMQNETVFGTFPNKIELYCYANGIPKPQVHWYKDDKRIISNRRIMIKNDGQKLAFDKTEVEDEGKYKCEVRNKVGSVSKQANLKFTNKADGKTSYVYIIIMVGFMVLFVAVLIYLCVKLRKEKKLKQELKVAGLANFEKGNVECLNPELGVDEQAELLPYERKWEFPREKLKLGKQLGSGAFGVVMKAEAVGINEDEPSTVVAVKMVKGNADPTGIKALASELKIMVHLGKHINVVNLLGACTKNVTKRELLVIVEYCQFGNLQNYLLRHRNNFVNQIDQKTGNIDPTIGRDELERTFSFNSNGSASLNYADLSFSNGSNNGGFSVPESMVDYRVNSNEAAVSANTEMTSICMTPTTEECPILSNNSSQPDWRSNYRGDYKGRVKPISTCDLVQWAFQISRGMDYLASRKVLHGDLAARNILLAENNVVKICDFGLAKSMYKNDNYKKKGSGLLPVKWMAVESISDRVFSTQSDVWSFGIVLWEFFSLACTPYPGMEANEVLYNKLVEGYRMEQPEYATNEIYQIMLDCWEKKPSDRPTFSQLEDKLGSILEEGVRKHYVSLNDPYLMMNTQRLMQQSDYLAMMSPPDYGNLASPMENPYINQNPSTSNDVPEDSSGYLCMRPTKAPDIFSPRLVDNENIFNFDLATVKKPKNQEPATGIELLPMLHSPNSDSDTESNSNDSSGNCVSNPNYYKPPSIGQTLTPLVESGNEKSPGEKEDIPQQDIVKSKDNYVNMPENKSAIFSKNKTQESSDSSSPTLISYKQNTDPEERFYVNGNVRAWDMPAKS